MSELIINRTPELIATEINIIKDQLNKQFIISSIEIGKKLIEAKSLVKHGDWGNWLQINVSYSKSTANNLMKIYQEYGSYQIEKSQAIGELGYTQAIALLGIKDPEEREKFIEDNDINELSTRELNKVIKELNDTKKEKELIENKVEKIESENKKLSDESIKLLDELHKKNNESIKTSEEIEKYKIKIKELEEKPIEVIGFDEGKVEEINKKHQEEISILNREKEKIERKLKEFESRPIDNNNDNILKYQIHFEELVKGFENLLVDIDAINKDNKTEGEKYSNAVKKLIILMQERL